MRQGVSAKTSRPDTVCGAKYPLMSMIRSVGLLASTVISPLVPAGTRAAFAITLPSEEFNVETPGKPRPTGQVERKPTGPGGTTVMFSEYACAVAGIPQLLDKIGKSRLRRPSRLGGPNAPVFP